MNELLDMGGYAIFVWSSYGIFFFSLIHNDQYYHNQLHVLKLFLISWLFLFGFCLKFVCAQSLHQRFSSMVKNFCLILLLNNLLNIWSFD